VLIGTSAGGLATVLAAATLPGLAGWVGLDPVDQTTAGADAARQLSAPAIVLLGDASVCNLFGSGKWIAQAAPTLMRSERLRGASHCDFEGPTNNFCRTVCGRSARGMAATVRSEAVSAALEMLDRAREEPALAPRRHGSLQSRARSSAAGDGGDSILEWRDARRSQALEVPVCA
jgi:hypothetical protein